MPGFRCHVPGAQLIWLDIGAVVTSGVHDMDGVIPDCVNYVIIGGKYFKSQAKLRKENKYLILFYKYSILSRNS